MLSMKMKCGSCALLLLCVVSISCQDIRTPASFITNGVTTAPNRYPYYVSLNSLENTPQNRTASFQEFCGGSLITDRLVLTAAHCAASDDFMPYYADATPSDFKELGLNFTAFPNTYVISQTLALSAFIGATSEAVSGSGNPITAWFVHPWFDPTNLYYDVAVGLLSTPVPKAQKVNLFNPPGDIYSQMPSTTKITAIGLGNLYTDDYADIESKLNSSFVDLNNSTSLQLTEAFIGTLTNRVICGKVLTANAQMNTSNGSGNEQFGQLATSISMGQMCVGEADNAALDARVQKQAQQIVSSANKLPSNVSAALQSDNVDPTNLQSVVNTIPAYNDTCQGDSGGPILIKGSDSTQDIQIGTVSYGVGCGSGLSGVYNSVQAYVNSTTFDNFLLAVLNAVPNSNGATANFVTSLPLGSEGASPSGG